MVVQFLAGARIFSATLIGCGTQSPFCPEGTRSFSLGEKWALYEGIYSPLCSAECLELYVLVHPLICFQGMVLNSAKGYILIIWNLVKQVDNIIFVTQIDNFISSCNHLFSVSAVISFNLCDLFLMIKICFICMLLYDNKIKSSSNLHSIKSHTLPKKLL